jgi:hypothetical protein
LFRLYRSSSGRLFDHFVWFSFHSRPFVIVNEFFGSHACLSVYLSVEYLALTLKIDVAETIQKKIKRERAAGRCRRCRMYVRSNYFFVAVLLVGMCVRYRNSNTDWRLVHGRRSKLMRW